jgi:hypothetical protein
LHAKPSVIAILQIITALGIVLFWAGFFTIGLAPDNPPPCYLAFEHAFPLPDTVLAIALLCSGILVLKQKPVAKDISLITAGALIFLGILDVSFNLQNSMYLISFWDTLLNGFINIYCIAFGILVFLAFKNPAMDPVKTGSKQKNNEA